VGGLSKLLREVRPDLIQWRNLNLDPDWYWQTAQPLKGGEPLGVAAILARVRREFPAIRFGYFNPPLRGSRAYVITHPASRPSPSTPCSEAHAGRRGGAEGRSPAAGRREHDGGPQRQDPAACTRTKY